MHLRACFPLVLVLCLVAAGCGSTTGGADASSSTPDSSTVVPSDASATAPDAAAVIADAASAAPDAQPATVDAGAGTADAHVEPPDAGGGFVVVSDIRDLQDPTRPGFVPAGTRVRLEGAVVTVTAGIRTFFFVQNPTGPAEYSGIRVGKGLYPGALPAEGSVITKLEATVVEEVRGTCGATETCPVETSLLLAGLSPIAATPGGTLPAPAVVTTASLAANPGPYEGVLVEIDGTTVLDAGPLSNGEAVWVEDGLVAFCIWYVPAQLPLVGATITRLAGPLAPYAALWEIYPRHPEDLTWVDPAVDAGVPDDAGTPDGGP